MRNLKTLGIIYLLMTLLAGCGFHLRGAVKLPSWFTQVYVPMTVNPALAMRLRTQLQAQGVSLSPTIDLAKVQLVLEPSIRRSSETVAGSETEFSLFLTTPYLVKSSVGKTILSGTAKQSGSYSYTTGRVLASDTNGVRYWTDPYVSWGNIEGTLSHQTDLQNALNDKEYYLGTPSSSGQVLSSDTRPRRVGFQWTTSRPDRNRAPRRSASWARFLRSNGMAARIHGNNRG